MHSYEMRVGEDERMGDRFGKFIDGGVGGVGDKNRVRGEGVGVIGLRGDGVPGGDGENDSVIHEFRGADVVHRSDF